MIFSLDLSKKSGEPAFTLSPISTINFGVNPWKSVGFTTYLVVLSLGFNEA